MLLAAFRARSNSATFRPAPAVFGVDVDPSSAHAARTREPAPEAEGNLSGSPAGEDGPRPRFSVLPFVGRLRDERVDAR